MLIAKLSSDFTLSTPENDEIASTSMNEIQSKNSQHSKEDQNHLEDFSDLAVSLPSPSPEKKPCQKEKWNPSMVIQGYTIYGIKLRN